MLVFNKIFRIFVALPILKIQKDVLNFQKKFKNLEVRWVLPQNLHVTLVPPWYEENIQEIKNKLKTLESKFLSFKVNFNSIDYGPNFRNPRLIWATGQCPLGLLRIRKEIFNVLNKNIENREFLLHLTLARFNFNKINNLPNLGVEIFWEEEIKEFRLMRSYLKKEGAEYEVLERITLK